MVGDLGVRGEPDALVRGDVVKQFGEDRDTGAVPDDVRVEGELEDAAFGVGEVELVAPDTATACALN
nr:hypothetical protein [Kibdelosporangium sp. MJ126-NF4]